MKISLANFLENRMLKNGFFNGIGSIIRLGLSVATIPLLIRLLGIQEYGLWVLVSSTAGLVVLVEAGLSHATTVFLSQDLAQNDHEGLAQTLTVTVGAMLIFVSIAVIALWLGTYEIFTFFKLNQTEYGIAVIAFRLGAIVVGQRLLLQITVAVIQAHQRYGILNLLSIIQSILTNIGLVVVAWFGGQILHLMEWQLVATSLILISYTVIAWRLLGGMNLHISWNLAKGKSIAQFSSMTWLGSLGGLLFAQADRVIVGTVLGTSALGVYAAITNVTKQINGLSALPVQPLLPTLSSILSTQEGTSARVEGQVKQSIQLNTCIALGMGGVLFILAPLVMKVILPGKIPPNQVMAFQLAAIIYATYSVNAVGYYVLFSMKAVKGFMLIQLGSGVLSIALIAIGAKYYGLMGAILGNSGYLGVWLFTIYGMQLLNIKATRWISWVIAPVLISLLVILLNIALPQNTLIYSGVAIIFSIVLLTWFLREQKLMQTNTFVG